MGIMLKDIPEDIRSSITDELILYTVGLFLDRQLIGSGTLIKCGDHLGILTAHHVVHSPDPPLDFSESSSQMLNLAIMRSSNAIQIPARYIIEIEIGKPISEENGPDLTFLKLPLGEELTALKSKMSFWDLDFHNDERLSSTLNDDGVWVKIGIPYEWLTVQQESEVQTNINSKMIGFFGFATSDCRYESGDFDFVDMVVHYGGRDQLPSTFEGLSGGGLWKVKVRCNSARDNWNYDKPVFCGVPFYQEEIVDEKRIVRCHYARSIYERVRNILLDSSHGRA